MKTIHLFVENIWKYLADPIYSAPNNSRAPEESIGGGIIQPQPAFIPITEQFKVQGRVS
jgi:hypothetical protein